MERSPFYSPVRVATFVVVLAIALTLALIPIDPERRLPTLGQAPEEPVIAAEDLRVESAVLSEEAAEAAAAAVAPRFTLDTGVRTAQVAVLANLLEAVDEVRDAPDLSDRERSSMLADLPDLRASARAQQDILGFSARRWQQVKDRSVTLLAEVLTDNVEEDEVPAVREGLPERVGDELRQSQQVDVVVELVAPLVEANVTEGEAATAAAREEARTAAEPVIREIARGTVVVGAGEVADALAAEVLALLPEQGRGVPIDELAALLILALASAGILGAYLLLAKPDAAASNRRLVLLAVLVIGSVAAARWFLPVVLPDEREKFLDLVLPLAIAAVLIAALLDRTLALLSATVVAILAGTAAVVHPNFGVGEAPEAPQALRPLVVFLLSGVAGAYTTQRIERLTRYGVAGVVVGATIFLVGLAFWLLDTGRATEDVGWLALVSAVVAVSTGVLAIGASSFLGLAFGVTTRWQLLELAQLTRPVLRRLQEEAPGTFHHSLLVATMAERAAAQVGADALLVRVGAYYHDIGKLAKPHMYIENQAEGGNPHDGLDPLESARVIQGPRALGFGVGAAGAPAVADPRLHSRAPRHPPGDLFLPQGGADQSGRGAESVHLRGAAPAEPRDVDRDAGRLVRSRGALQQAAGRGDDRPARRRGDRRAAQRTAVRGVRSDAAPAARGGRVVQGHVAGGLSSAHRIPGADGGGAAPPAGGAAADGCQRGAGAGGGGAGGRERAPQASVLRQRGCGRPLSAGAVPRAVGAAGRMS